MNQPAEVWIKQPHDIPAHIKYAHKNGRGLLTFEQIDELVKAINPAYVSAKQGKSYLAQHQARAEMNRIFGYGNWDLIEDAPVFLYEEQSEKNGVKWRVCYRMTVTVSVRDLWGMPVCTVTGTHAEANANLPDRSEAHGMALTSVSSYAFRRAMINLGDRFGLGLYDGGKTDAHGQYTIQQNPGLLYDWVQAGPDGNPIVVNAQRPAVITHETIQAQPVVSDDGTDPNWVDPDQRQAMNEQAVVSAAVAQAAQQPPMDQTMPLHQAQQIQQDNREQARQQAAPPQPQQQQQQYVPQDQYVPNPATLGRLQQGFKQPSQTNQEGQG